jgi:hypothetical protein
MKMFKIAENTASSAAFGRTVPKSLPACYCAVYLGRYYLLLCLRNDEAGNC